MALSDPLSISPTTPTIGTGSDVDFVVTSRAGSSCERLNDATTLSDPEKLVIKHQVTGTEKQGNLVDRHLVQLSRVERDSDGVAHACVVNVTMSVPRNGLFSTAEVTRQVAILANLLFDTGMTAAILQNQS
jgi:hypothetical protein